MTQTDKNFLFIINDGPYGNERAYNALRLAMNLAKREQTKVRVFLLGDVVNCAIANPKTPSGFYNIECMLSSITRRGEFST